MCNTQNTPIVPNGALHSIQKMLKAHVLLRLFYIFFIDTQFFVEVVGLKHVMTISFGFAFGSKKIEMKSFRTICETHIMCMILLCSPIVHRYSYVSSASFGSFFRHWAGLAIGLDWPLDWTRMCLCCVALGQIDISCVTPRYETTVGPDSGQMAN